MARPTPDDESAIRDLYARYSWALDTGDTDGYVALFTDDAEATRRRRRVISKSARGATRSASWF